MAPLRILVAANLPNDRAGGATRIMGYPHDLIAQQGHAVEYFYADAGARYGARGKWARFTFPLALVRFLLDRRRSGVNFDVVNVHEPSGVALLAWRRFLGNPAVVATTHGIERRAFEIGLEELRVGRAGPSLRTRIGYPLTSLWQSALTLSHADHVLCLSEEERTYLLRRQGRADATVTRIFPAADVGFARAAARRDYARSNRILFAGTWRKNKGIEDLVVAFATLAARRPEVSLTVLGGGVPADVVLSAFPAKTRPQVHCARAVTDDETMATFAAHDLFVLPSLFEGTPLTMMEAMTSGLPVVTTNTCGMRDVIRDGENGLLVPIRDSNAIVAAIERLLRSADLRSQLGRAGQAEVLDRYTWRHTAEAILRVYESVARPPTAVQPLRRRA